MSAFLQYHFNQGRFDGVMNLQMRLPKAIECTANRWYRDGYVQGQIERLSRINEIREIARV